MSVDVPETVPCPCENGYADRREETVVEPGPMNRQRTTHVYRHDGCHIGGHLVVEGSYVLRRAGPLFRPTRYGIGLVAATDTPPIATDGGAVE